MLRTLLVVSPPIALVLVAVLLVEPPYFTPAYRVPTLRLLTGGGEDVATPEEQLRGVLSRLLGPSNRGVPRVGSIDLHSDHVVVEWQLNQPDSSPLRRATAQQDVYALLRWASLVSTPTGGWNPSRFTFVGSHGVGPDSQSGRQALELTYSVEQVAGIDWGTFSPQDVYVMADAAVIDPSLR